MFNGFSGHHEKGLFESFQRLFFFSKGRIGIGLFKAGDLHQFMAHLECGSHQVELSLHGFFQQHPDNEHPVDLVRALVDARYTNVAVGTLHGRIG